MSDPSTGTGTPDPLERLVRAALDAAGLFAQKGSVLTTGVALIALCMSGAAYVLGLAAFDGGTRSAWLVAGAIIVLLAVGAPLLASFRLRSLPRQSPQIASELRGLLRRDPEAKRIVIDTVATVDGEDFGEGTGASGTMPSGRAVPPVVFQSQNYTKLRTISLAAGDTPQLTKLFHRLATLPGLVAIGLVLSALSAVLAFVFALIWIF